MKLTWNQRHKLKCATAAVVFGLVALVVADVASDGGIRAGLQGKDYMLVWTNEDGTTTRHYTYGPPRLVIVQPDEEAK